MMKVVSYNQHYLPDSVWERIEPYLPKRIRTSTRGRPACDLRKTIEGILWVLKSGARWRDLPDEYPSDTTCWRKLKELEQAGIWEKLWQLYLGMLKKEQQLETEETYLDASFVRSKKGGTKSEQPGWARG